MWLDISDEVDKGIWLDAYGEPVTWFKWGPRDWVEMDLSGYSGHSSQSSLKNWNDIFFTTTLNGGFNCFANISSASTARYKQAAGQIPTMFVFFG